jgi:hypothetical protein
MIQAKAMPDQRASYPPEPAMPAVTAEGKPLFGKLSSFLNQVLPLILTVVTLVMGVQITQSYKLAEDIGSIKERLKILIEANEAHTTSINDLRPEERRAWERLTANSGVLATVSSQVNSIKGSITRMQDKYDEINDLQQMVLGIGARLHEMEADPTKILRQHGMQLVSGFAAASIEGELFVFPINEAALTRLKEEGYEPRQITPAITGFSLSK